MAVMSQMTGVKMAIVDPSKSIPASVPKPAEVSTARLLTPVLRTADQPTRAAIGEAVPLGLNVEGPTDGVLAIVAGLPAGSNLSVGTPVGPTDWQLPARDLARVLVQPPVGFSGAMEMTVDLQGAGDRILDRRWRRLEWRAVRAATADASVAVVSETNAIALSTTAPPKPSPTLTATNARRTTDSVARASPTKGSYVQVASQRTEPDAHSSFKALQAKYPELFGSRQATIRRAHLGDKGVYYRVMIGPLGIEQANELCGSLRASGGQCLVQQN
jgi:SPOR domain